METLTLTDINESIEFNQNILFLGYKNKADLDPTIHNTIRSNKFQFEFYDDTFTISAAITNSKSALVVIDTNHDVLQKIEMYKILKAIHPKLNILILVTSENKVMVRQHLGETSSGTWVADKPIEKEAFLDILKETTFLSSPLNSEIQLQTLRDSGPLKRTGTKTVKYFRTRKEDNTTDVIENKCNDGKDPVFDPAASQNLDEHQCVKDLIFTNKIIAKLGEIIFMSTNLSKSNNFNLRTPPVGMLLTGKHMLDKLDMIRSIADRSKIKFYYIDCREILSFKRYGEPEELIRQTYSNAKADKTFTASIIYLDQLDSLTSYNGLADAGLINRILGQLLTSMNGVSSDDRILVVGSAGTSSSLNEMLLIEGRFDIDVSVDSPEIEERLSILQSIASNTNLNKDVNLVHLATITEGFGRSELRELVRKASAHALKSYVESKYVQNDRNFKTNTQSYMTNIDFLNKDKIHETLFTTSMDDFIFSMRPYKGRLKGKRKSPLLATKWEDIGGYSKIIEEIRESLEWPLKYPKLFNTAGITSPKGILLYGPPGNGKTKIAKSILSNFPQATFINVKGPELISKWIGESEMALRETFQQARECAPSIIFIDEIDSIMPVRSSDFDKSEVMNRMVSQMLIEMDGLESLQRVVVIGATNRIDAIDKALLRPGRFDKLLYIPPPTKEDRFEILKVLTKQLKLSKDIDLESVANQTEKYTGADLYGLIMEAKKESLRELIVTKDIKNSNIQNTRDFYINNNHILKAKIKLDARESNKKLDRLDAYG